MILPNIKIAFRRLYRNTVFSSINIGGLALGIAAFLLVLQYVSFEQSINYFHKDIAITYRLLNQDINEVSWPQIEPGWAGQIKERFPEVTDYCRFDEGVAKGIVRPIDNNTLSFREENIGYAEGNFFTFFTFPWLQGNASNALKSPNSVCITPAVAQKYFGTTNVLGKQLQLFNQFGSQTYTVTGIFETPAYSDIKYDMVFSLETLKNPANLNGNSWAQLDNLGSQFISTFFKVQKGTSIAGLEKKLTQLRNELGKENDGVKFKLQPFGQMHLAASLNDTLQTTGDLKYVYILSLIGLQVLLIAWFNYINLSTAQALQKANEVGVRKVVGASRQSLVIQFLLESLLVNVAGLVLALVIVLLLQPFFNQLIGRELHLLVIFNGNTWLIALGLLLIGSLLSGAYTAYSLSGFKPVDILKAKIIKSSQGVLLRKSLVVCQFAISMALILATVFIHRQLLFMQQSKLGVNTHQIMVVRGPEVGRDSTLQLRKNAFSNWLSNQSFIKVHACSGTIPGGWYNFSTAGFTQPASKAGDDLKTYSFAIIDQQYLPTYEIGVKAGRNFTAAECDLEWNDNSKIMMNERGIQQLGFPNAEAAVGQKIQWDERPLEIIGVVKDYHHTGLQKAIDPMIFYPQNNSAYFNIRLSTNQLQSSIAKVEQQYKAAFPGNPFEYFFADDHFEQQYATERQYGQLFTLAAIWAVVIACLGLFGLTTYAVENRRREIGIRKVLGASVYSITRLISKDFLQLVVLAALLAFPIAWYGLNLWLQNFAYKISLHWAVFVVVGFTGLLLALFTICLKAVAAAGCNPIKSIRTE